MKFSPPVLLSTLAATALLLLPGCATRRLPPYERPLARTEYQAVRTTAYTHSEDDHRQYGKHNGEGTLLTAGAVKSAAADWSRWPVGTLFRICPEGDWYRVDDYGWALAGTNTIDLYMPTRDAMNGWGTRRVTIQVLQWGDDRRSREILEPRAKHKHVRRMLKDLRKHT